MLPSVFLRPLRNRERRPEALVAVLLMVGEVAAVAVAGFLWWPHEVYMGR